MQLFSLERYRGKRVCVAVSGGADSVALLHYFYTHAGEFAVSLSALTCEHGIRGAASLGDLAFVEAFCKERGIPLHVFREDVPALARAQKIGLEEAGRTFRYACYRTLLDGDAADLVATAHHRDDLIETVLFRLIRGTSLGGLNAFPAREGVVRPLLNVPHGQIMQYVKENSLSFVTDGSNSDEAFTRNYLRHTVLPALEKAVNGAGEHLAEFACRAAEDDEYLQVLAQSAVKRDGGDYAIPAGLPAPLFTRACVFAMKALGAEKDYTQANVCEIAALQCTQSGKSVCLPQGLRAVREYGNIVIYRPAKPFSGEFPFAVGTFAWDGGFVTVFEERDGKAVLDANTPDPKLIGVTDRALRVDLDAFPEGCVIRTRREGDVFTPFGGSRKTLKKFLTDQKISARRGRMLPLVAKGNEIFAVCGAEISDQVKITPQTVRRGCLCLSAASGGVT